MSTAFSRRKLLLAGLWLTAAAAEWAALRPVIFQEHVRPEVVLYHVVGGSFAACGLLAWHRRPESRAGPLMVVTGLLFFVHGTLGRLHSSFAETIGIAVSNSGSSRSPRSWSGSREAGAGGLRARDS